MLVAASRAGVVEAAHDLSDGGLAGFLTDLVARTGLGQANVSKHLQQLCTAGFIPRRKEGTFAYYALADDEVVSLCDSMCGRIEVDQQRKRAALRLTR